MSSGTKESDAYHLAEERGCYVFAMRNRGLNPIYVVRPPGASNKKPSIRGTDKYRSGCSDYGKGTPFMYFVVHPTQRGRANTKQIAEVANFLIQAGFAKNPRLQNVKGTQQPDWSIKGVIHSSGKPKRLESAFRSLFDIRG